MLLVDSRRRVQVQMRERREVRLRARRRRVLRDRAREAAASVSKSVLDQSQKAHLDAKLTARVAVEELEAALLAVGVPANLEPAQRQRQRVADRQRDTTLLVGAGSAESASSVVPLGIPAG